MMIQSQEIIERSFYTEIHKAALTLGLTLNPEDYYPPSKANQDKFNIDRQVVIDNHGLYLAIFGVGNNQSRDEKILPRITIESEGFYPGDVGLPKQMLEKQIGIGYTATEVPYETINQYINIRLVANTQKEMRLLHNLLYASIPQRGYIKPWPSEVFLESGNVFMELFNYFNRHDVKEGILEHVYQFVVYDTLLVVKDIPSVIVPINAITLLLDNVQGREPEPLIELPTNP